MNISPSVLVTGGAGFVGSHTLVELLASGLGAVCPDNFCNSSIEAVRRVEQFSGHSVRVVGDVRDLVALQRACEAAPVVLLDHRVVKRCYRPFDRAERCREKLVTHSREGAVEF